LESVILREFAAADVAARPRKGNRGNSVFHSFTTDEYGMDTMSARIRTIETFF
jgi:methionyl-tRNA synthetase